MSTFEALNEYEHALHRMLRGRRMLLLCTYSLLSSTAADVFDVVSAHEITVARRNGTWQFMEPADVQDRARTLTEREREVLSWIARGKTAIEIALILGITKRTVDEHTHNATRKLAAVNRAQAVAVALRSRLIEM